jgi:hypothetical protein
VIVLTINLQQKSYLSEVWFKELKIKRKGFNFILHFRTESEPELRPATLWIRKLFFRIQIHQKFFSDSDPQNLFSDSDTDSDSADTYFGTNHSKVFFQWPTNIF